MARSGRFSTVSIDEVEGRGNKIKYISETEALRPVAKSTHPDDYPCFVLEDTKVYLQDGKTIANLLNAELEGPFVVRGRLNVDGDLSNRLFNKKSNGQYIVIPKCESFSIGDNPVTLWALGQSGWLEIQPSEKYQKMYRKMAAAVSIFYFVTDLYEREQRKKGSTKSKTPLTIDKILLKYAIYEGTGLVRPEAAERLKSHAQFLLSQMRKVDFGWQSTELFKWLSAECADVYNKLLAKTGDTILPPIPIALAKLPTPTPQLAPPPEPLKPKPKAIPSHLRTSHHPPTRSTPTINLSSQSPSATPPPSCSTYDHLPDTCTPLIAILSLLRSRKLDIRGWSPLPRMTFSKLGTLLYYAYKLKGEPISQEVVRLNASAVVAALGPEWKVAPLYEQLKEAALKPSTKSENRTIALGITEVKRRGEKNLTRNPVPRSSRQSSERVQAHGSKSLFPPQSARRSGKEAGLRLASSPAMKRLERAESEEDDGLRSRKRRRPSPPEMGDESDSGSPAPVLANIPIFPETSPSEEDDGDGDNDEPAQSRPTETLKMVTEALPTLSPSGPNGSWSCDRESCVFVVRDAESEEGKQTIRQHFLMHAEQLEREALARREAAQWRLPIDHLLEKLRSMGEERRLGMQEVIGGRVVPERIKRERGLAI